MPVINVSTKYLLRKRLEETSLTRVSASNQAEMLEILEVFGKEEQNLFVKDTGENIKVEPMPKNEVYKEILSVLRENRAQILKKATLMELLVPLCFLDRNHGDFVKLADLTEYELRAIKGELNYYYERHNLLNSPKSYRDDYLLRGVLGGRSEGDCRDMDYIVLANSGGSKDFDTRYNYVVTELLPLVKNSLAIVKWEKTDSGIICLKIVPHSILLEDTDNMNLMYIHLRRGQLKKLKEEIKIVNAFYKKESFLYSNKKTNQSYLVFGKEELYTLLCEHYLKEEAYLKVIEANKQETMDYLSNKGIYVENSYELLTGENVYIEGIEETGRVLVRKKVFSLGGGSFTHHSIEPELILTEDTSRILKLEKDMNKKIGNLDSKIEQVISQVKQVREDIDTYKENRQYLDRRVEQYLPVSSVEKRIIEQAEFDNLSSYEKRLLAKKEEEKWYADMEEEEKRLARLQKTPSLTPTEYYAYVDRIW